VLEQDRPVGILRRNDLVKALAQGRPEASVSEAMCRDCEGHADRSFARAARSSRRGLSLRVPRRGSALHLRAPEKEHFVQLLREAEEFCEVRILTYCLMSNHFHVLVEVPKAPEPHLRPSPERVLAKLAKLSGHQNVGLVRQRFEMYREARDEKGLAEYLATFHARLWDLSQFMKLVKQRFTLWYNLRVGRTGTLWEDRFKSVLVEGQGQALVTMAAYIDLNPVRAGLVKDPKDYRWSGYGEAVAGKEAGEGGDSLAGDGAATGAGGIAGQVVGAVPGVGVPGRGRAAGGDRGGWASVAGFDVAGGGGGGAGGEREAAVGRVPAVSGAVLHGGGGVREPGVRGGDFRGVPGAVREEAEERGAAGAGLEGTEAYVLRDLKKAVFG
jgi:REP element-mobilizing transposase RayT